MKRIIVRLSALTGVVVLGLVAIALTQREDPDAHAAVQPSALVSGAEAAERQPIPEPGAALEETAAAADDTAEPKGTIENPFGASPSPVPAKPIGFADDTSTEVPAAEAMPAEAAVHVLPASETTASDAIPAGYEDDIPAANTLDPQQALAQVDNHDDGTAPPSVSGGRYSQLPSQNEPTLAPPQRFPIDGPQEEAPVADRYDRTATRTPSRLSTEQPGRLLPQGNQPTLAPPQRIEEHSPQQAGSPEDAPRSSISGQSAMAPEGSTQPRVRAGITADGLSDGYSRTAAPGDSFSEPAATSAAEGVEGAGVPGGNHLDGTQTPSISILKTAPDEIQVGKPAIFTATIVNTGDVPAHDVEVRDEVPRGTRLLRTQPKASQGARGELVWKLNTLEPGAEATVSMEVQPVAEGEIGSVARVYFAADASVRTISTRPELVVQLTSQREVMIGEQVTMTIKVSNPGTGIATGVVLEEDVPRQLEHPAGAKLEYELGDLPPKESRELQLTMTAVQAGAVQNILRAYGDGDLEARDTAEFTVVSPSLAVAVDGPKKRYLDRPATYTVEVSNPGTAEASGVQLVAHLPKGMKFVRADNGGRFDEASHTIYWQFDRLPAEAAGQVNITAIPIEAGTQRLVAQTTAEKGLAAEDSQDVEVEGVSAILFEVVDVQDPIEIGADTTYEIRVVNQGSKGANNVRIVAAMPEGMQFVAAEGPTQHAYHNGQIVFDSLTRLAPKADTTYRVRMKGADAGDLRFRVQLITDELREPVLKEESTRVYSDE